MVWLGPGFHPSYSGAQPKFCAVFCQWFPWSHSRFLPLWLRSVSWPFPVVLSSPLLLWLHMYRAFSSLKNRCMFSYLLRLLWERQLLRFMLWSNRLGIWGWIYRPLQRPWRMHRLEHWLSDGRAGLVETWPKSPVTADGFCKLKLVLPSNFHKAMGEEALGSSPGLWFHRGVGEIHAPSWKQCSWDVVSQLLSTCIHFYYC